MAENPNMKKNDLSERRCRFRIVLEGQTEEQMDQPKKLFSGVGVKMLISIETNRAYDFPGGPDPIPPLDLSMHSFFRV